MKSVKGAVKGAFGGKIGGKASSTPPAPAGKTKSAKDAQDEKEKKEKDNVAKLKDRLAKGHRLNDQELAQLELAAVARWNQLQREDEEEIERQRQAEAEKERQREQRLAKELKELRSAAAADRANLERAGAAVADELRELRELRDAAAADRATLESSVANELKELREMRDNAAREAARRAKLSAEALAEEQELLGSIYGGDGAPHAGSPIRGSSSPNQRHGSPTWQPPSPPHGSAEAPAVTNTSGGPSWAGSNPAEAPSASGGTPYKPLRDAHAKPWATPGGASSSSAAPKPKKKKPKPPPEEPQQPLDPAEVLHLASLEDYYNDQARKAEKRGDPPPSRQQVESQWYELPMPLRLRYEREAGIKLQRAGMVTAADLADAKKLKPGQCSTSVANPMPEMTYENPDGFHGSSKARVDFRGRPIGGAGRGGAAGADAATTSVKRKRGPPPEKPLGSPFADWITLLALIALFGLLGTRQYRCNPVEWSEWKQWVSMDALPDAVKQQISGLTSGKGGRRLGGGGDSADDLVAKVSDTVTDALADTQRATTQYASSLSTEIETSCSRVALFTEPGSGLLHLSALIVALVTLLTLIGQLWARCCGKAKSGDDSKQPLLPVSSEEGGGSAAAAVVEAAADSSYSPWTSLACAELFIAGYAARLFTGGPGGKSAGDGTMAWLGLAPTSSAAHFWVIVCSCMLLFAAIRRFLQMYSWRRRYAEWLNPPPPKPPPQKPPPKPSSTPVRGGKTPAKTPSKPQKSWWEKCFGGGAPGASKDAKGRGGSSSIGGGKGPLYQSQQRSRVDPMGRSRSMV